MIARIPLTVTNNHTADATVRGRLAPIRAEMVPPENCEGNPSTRKSPPSMGPLQHLICAGLGLMSFAGFVGVIGFGLDMLFKQCAPVSMHQLLQAFGG